MKKVLYNTVVVNQRCDLACTYCDTRNHSFIRHLDQVEDKKETFIKTIEKYNQLFSAEILEIIGGGEVFLEKDVHKWIEPFVDVYDHVEIVTNGMDIPFDDIKAIDKMVSFSLAVSIDGHTYDMCGSRYPEEAVFRKVFNNVMRLLEEGIYVRLRTVMNPSNRDHIMEYLEFLLPYKDRISLSLTPVKDKIQPLNLRQDYNEKYLESVDAILANHERYKSFIGPYGYFEELKNYFLQKGKQLQCFVPFIKTLILIDGKQTACSVNWIKELPNIHTLESSEGIFEQDIFKLMNRKKPVISACKEDFGDCDMFNLYMHDRVSPEELAYFKPYTHPRILERFKTLKEELMPKKK